MATVSNCEYLDLFFAKRDDMKKVNLLSIIAIVLFFSIGVALFFVLGNKGNKSDVNDVLDCSTLSEVKEYIEQNKVESYSFDTDICRMSNVSVLGCDASLDFYFENESTDQIKVYYTLFQCIDENASEEELESFDVMSYNFTQRDKEEIVKAFNNVKSSFERKIGCTLEQYDLVPAHEGVAIEDDDDKFYQGLLVKEYSVRDTSGILWLLRFEASYGMARATLIKVVDDSGYEGFIPKIDMTKK